MRFPTLQKSGFVMPEGKLRADTGYHSAGQGRRATNWYAPDLGPNTVLVGNLQTLRNRSRAAVRNDAYGRATINRLVSNIVGTGIKPVSKIRDTETKEEVQETFGDWADESDADGVLNFYGQQTLVARSWLEGGDCFVRFRQRRTSDGFVVPLQIQVFEAEFVPEDYNVALSNGNQVRAGIEFNKIGQRVAYWMYSSHPSDYETFDASQLKRIPAREIIHIHQPLRPGALRGEPVLTQALLRMHHLDKFDDANLLRQEIGNLFAGFIERPEPEDESVDPITGEAIETDDNDLANVSLEPGIMRELEPGEKVNFNKPPDAGSNYPEFMRQQLLAIAASTDLPYELLTGDMSNVNDRTLRVILNQFKRSVRQQQHHVMIHQFCRPVWNRWFDMAVLSGAMEVPGFADAPRRSKRVKWQADGWEYMHPLQDVQAKERSVRAGFTSRSQVVSEMPGHDDAESLDAENRSDAIRADELDLRYDSDPRFTSSGDLKMESDAADDTGDGNE